MAWALDDEKAGSAAEDVDGSVDEEVAEAAEDVGALEADFDLVEDVVVVKAELEEEVILEGQSCPKIILL